MELTCRLSPVVYAELYKLLRREPRTRNRVHERLEELSRGPEWLDQIIERYEALWEYDSQNEEPLNTAQEERMDAELATWLIAPLRATGPSDEFSAELRAQVQDEARKRFPHGALPEWFRGAVLAWTLGRVCGQLDSKAPVIPGDWPADPDVTAAYGGFLHHVIDLPEQTPWPEMRGSSIVIRVAGLAEGLDPRRDLAASLSALTNDPVIPAGLASRLRGDWVDFARMRNGCAHVHREDGGYGLSQLTHRFSDSDSVRNYVQVASYFVCSAISERLNEGGRLGRETMLEDPLGDIGWLLAA